jgi:hypothetical protein
MLATKLEIKFNSELDNILARIVEKDDLNESYSKELHTILLKMAFYYLDFVKFITNDEKRYNIKLLLGENVNKKFLNNNPNEGKGIPLNIVYGLMKAWDLDRKKFNDVFYHGEYLGELNK